MINLPLTIERDAFYDTKTTCFTINLFIFIVRKFGDIKTFAYLCGVKIMKT